MRVRLWLINLDSGERDMQLRRNAVGIAIALLLVGRAASAHPDVALKL